MNEHFKLYWLYSHNFTYIKVINTFGPSAQFPGAINWPGVCGLLRPPLGYRGNAPLWGSGGQSPPAENEFKHFWAQKMTSPGSCCCYLRLQFWGRISINCAAQLVLSVNTSFLPIFQLATIVTYSESSLGHLLAVWKHFKSFTINSCDLVDLYYNHWADTNYLKVCLSFVSDR